MTDHHVAVAFAMLTLVPTLVFLVLVLSMTLAAWRRQRRRYWAIFWTGVALELLFVVGGTLFVPGAFVLVAAVAIVLAFVAHLLITAATNDPLPEDPAARAEDDALR